MWVVYRKTYLLADNNLIYHRLWVCSSRMYFKSLCGQCIWMWIRPWSIILNWILEKWCLVSCQSVFSWKHWCAMNLLDCGVAIMMWNFFKGNKTAARLSWITLGQDPQATPGCLSLTETSVCSLCPSRCI